jgi:beta-lactamase regulating signal transducer with metallopeptidase domain/protocatechuate 3,4-dioxygenase beta subunit
MNTLAGWYPGDGAALAALEVSAMVAALVASAAVAGRFLARRRPAVRAALWQAALVGVLAAPAVAVLGRGLPWRVVVLPAASVADDRTDRRPPPEDPALPGTSGLPAGESGERAPPEPPVQRQPVGAPGVDAGSAPQRAPTPIPSSGASPDARSRAAVEGPPASTDRVHAAVTLAFLAWGLGCVLLSVRLLHGWWRLRRLSRRLRPLDDGPRDAALEAAARTLGGERLPGVYLSPAVRGPLLVGLRAPRVILPERLPAACSPRQLCDVVVHECAHAVRRDVWVCLLQRLVGTVYWPHPFVWLLNGRLDVAREEVCDNHVLAGADPPGYAETLLAVARVCFPVAKLEGHLAMIPRHHNLERRVAGLLEEHRDRATRLRPGQRFAVGAALVLALAALSSVGLRAAPPAKAPPEAAGQAPGAPPAVMTSAQPPLRGTVLAPDGSPAAGAIVWAAKIALGPLQHHETVTDERGEYSLSLAPGDWLVRARRNTQGAGVHADGQIKIAAGRTHVPVTLRLEERGTFRGRLVEAETGKPIPGGRLFLDAGFALTADADGRFATGGLSRESHESFVVAPGRMRLRVLFDTTARADTELEVPVPRGGKIVGSVTDPHGRPIPGAYVGRASSGSFVSINALYVDCDARGRFEFDDATVPGQPTRLSAAAPGFIGDDRAGLVTTEDRPLEVHFRLRPKSAGHAATPPPPGEEARRMVSGVVRGPDGKPAADVVVRWGYEHDWNTIHTRTDAEGRFSLNVPDKADLLAVLPRAFQPAFPQVTAGGDRTVDVSLRAGATVRGRVVDDTAKPVEGATVIARVGSPDARICNPYWLQESAARTDATGRFEVKGVPDGAHFDVLKAGLSDVRDVALALNEADHTVKMQYGGAVRGRVVDQDGKPVRNFRVLVNMPRERKRDDKLGGYFAGFCGMGVRFTSPDGVFVLTGVGAGTVLRISAVAEGYGEAVADRVTAVPLNHLDATEPVALRAGPPVSLRVRVAGAGGKPVAGALVTLINGDPSLDSNFAWGYHDASWEDMVRCRTDAAGRANFPALSFGDATVLVQAPGYARRRLGWRDRRKELEVELAPEAVLAGEVHEAGGEPVKAFYVRLMSGGDQIGTSYGPDAKGRFRLGELPAGKWSIVIGREGDQKALYQETTTLGAGETRELPVVAKKE